MKNRVEETLSRRSSYPMDWASETISSGVGGGGPAAAASSLFFRDMVLEWMDGLNTVHELLLTLVVLLCPKDVPLAGLLGSSFGFRSKSMLEWRKCQSLD